MGGETWQLGPLRVPPGEVLRGVFQVDVGLTRIDFPLALIHGVEPGPTVLVTAGMDGDEYASSEAALRLIDELDPTQLRGRVMVCPVLDPLSFEALHSQNPLDGLFLRHHFPGDLEGKPTQRLAYFIYHNFVLPADVWIALESPPIGDASIPFVFTFQGDDAHMNEQNRALLACAGAGPAVVYPVEEWPPALPGMVATTALLVSSAGERLRTDAAMAQAHRSVVRSVLHGLEMAPLKAPPAEPAYYPATTPLLAGQGGLWYPRLKAGAAVQAGEIIGALYQMDGGAVLEEIVSPVDGLLLAARDGLAARARLRLALVAHAGPPGS